MPSDQDRARAREWGKSRYPENMMISGWWKGDTESLAQLLAEVRAEGREQIIELISGFYPGRLRDEIAAAIRAASAGDKEE